VAAICGVVSAAATISASH